MRFNWAIHATLKAGTRPEIAHFISPVDRSETVAKIEGLLHNRSSCDGLFGVILGPSGTGKTYATRVACNADSSFILYCEIYEPHKTRRRFEIFQFSSCVYLLRATTLCDKQAFSLYVQKCHQKTPLQQILIDGVDLQWSSQDFFIERGKKTGGVYCYGPLF